MAETRKGLHCLDCDDVIVSLSVHDWRSCECGNVFVDGGADYLRYGFMNQNFEVVDVYL